MQSNTSYNNIAYKCGFQDGEIATLKKELETLINIKNEHISIYNADSLISRRIKELETIIMEYKCGFQDGEMDTLTMELQRFVDIRFENKELHNEESTIVRRIRKLESVLKLY